ncbi:transcriptional antiterminator NusG [Ruminiclostridium sufflavum DSM 19573]|uniref:Transcription termination/antitermination protein NusG n=1 Tax=Ruminiclostridium sufflavum DSM 19573 TaxID=1121337 RepID=A0A318XQ98_9FIRM|nr:antiterminator LoaP [Ruminiclostridium sufflavum]PYG89500.1 transcriptional antiterminator NusG [Ruminiclostridium sufflavum DSM 19573]
MNEDLKWYALFVATGEEDRVKERIHFIMKAEIKALVPKRKMKERKEGIWKERIRPLFPGYVLLNGQISSRAYNLITGIPGVIRFLKDSAGPQEIYKHEIWFISKLLSEGDIVGYSNIYIKGGKIEVTDGPLYGLEGLIQSVDRRKGRVKVLVDLMGQPRTVELCVTMIQPA